MRKTYEAGVPAHCPPTQAQDEAATLYRACASNPPRQEDYVSHINSADPHKRALAKRKLKFNPNDCTPSGLSVWITKKDMEHACDTFDFMKGKFIFETVVQKGEGSLQMTGAKEHHTYWPLASTALLNRATFSWKVV